MDFSDLKGKTLLKIDGDIGSTEVIFFAEDGNYRLFHAQD